MLNIVTLPATYLSSNHLNKSKKDHSITMIEQEEKLLDISIICWLSGDTKPAFQSDLL